VAAERSGGAALAGPDIILVVASKALSPLGSASALQSELVPPYAPVLVFLRNPKQVHLSFDYA
jgi:hypothetical protein